MATRVAARAAGKGGGEGDRRAVVEGSGKRSEEGSDGSMRRGHWQGQRATAKGISPVHVKLSSRRRDSLHGEGIPFLLWIQSQAIISEME